MYRYYIILYIVLYYIIETSIIQDQSAENSYFDLCEVIRETHIYIYIYIYIHHRQYHPNLVEMFPKDSVFCACKSFRYLKVLMTRADPYSIKTLKEINQDPGSSDFMRRSDYVDNISSFGCFATIFFLNQKLSHMHHTKYDIFTIFHKMWQTRCWIN